MTARPLPSSADVTVVGGGLVGVAIALGVARRGLRVAILDEGDTAHRASRGNFALVWVQSKGLGMAEYGVWTLRSAEGWANLARSLVEETGIDVAYERPGGLMLALSEDELQRRSDVMTRLHNQEPPVDYAYEILDHARTKAMLPAIGPEVAGAVYCPLDGHVNSLRLFRALHAAFAGRGGAYVPEAGVERIESRAGGFCVTTAKGVIESGKLVLAAGLGNARLAPMVGLEAPVRPQRGQIVVTERVERFLDYPVTTVRQTDEGSVMIGDSQEEAGLHPHVGTAITAVMADRAVRMFPLLARAQIVRSWAALRVMTRDGFPIYDASETCPGAFLATCHSGVTLAANHAGPIAEAVVAGRLPGELDAFSARRFERGDTPAVSWDGSAAPIPDIAAEREGRAA